MTIRRKPHTKHDNNGVHYDLKPGMALESIRCVVSKYINIIETNANLTDEFLWRNVLLTLREIKPSIGNIFVEFYDTKDSDIRSYNFKFRRVIDTITAMRSMHGNWPYDNVNALDDDIFKECNYTNASLLDDFNHVKYYNHNCKEEEISDIDYFTDGIIRCDIAKCKHIQNHYRDRKTMKHEYMYGGNDNNKCMIALISRVHVHFIHAQINRLTLEELEIINKTIEEIESQDTIKKCTDDIIKVNDIYIAIRPYVHEFLYKLQRIFDDIILFTANKKEEMEGIIKSVHNYSINKLNKNKKEFNKKNKYKSWKDVKYRYVICY